MPDPTHLAMHSSSAINIAIYRTFCDVMFQHASSACMHNVTNIASMIAVSSSAAQRLGKVAAELRCSLRAGFSRWCLRCCWVTAAATAVAPAAAAAPATAPKTCHVALLIPVLRTFTSNQTFNMNSKQIYP